MVYRAMSEDKKTLGQRYQALVETHQGILIKVAGMYCRLREDRQDLIQEMMIQVWKSFPRYNPRLNASTWLYRVCLNVAISHLRKKSAAKRQTVFLQEEALPAPAEMPDTEQQLCRLEQFIGELNDLDKALMLLYLEEKSQPEIAEILGLSLTNVSTKVGRIKERLKKRFEQTQS